MRIILTKDVANLGNKGDIVEVANGYARNFLIPSNSAIVSTKGAELQAETMKKARAAKMAKLKVEADALAAKITSDTIEIPAKAREDGKLFGSVNSQNIVSVLNKQFSLSLTKNEVLLEAPIKEVGEAKVQVVLHEDVTQEITVNITQS